MLIRSCQEVQLRTIIFDAQPSVRDFQSSMVSSKKTLGLWRMLVLPFNLFARDLVVSSDHEDIKNVKPISKLRFSVSNLNSTARTFESKEYIGFADNVFGILYRSSSSCLKSSFIRVAKSSSTSTFQPVIAIPFATSSAVLCAFCVFAATANSAECKATPEGVSMWKVP